MYGTPRNVKKTDVACATPKSFSEELRNVLQERNLLTAKSRRKVCAMLTGDKTPTSTPEVDKRMKYRRQAVVEILESEKTYLEQLELLITYFVRPIREQKIIEDKIFSALFGQIEMIYNLNSEFLNALNENENVAQEFLKMAPFFKLYSVYAFDYGKSLLLLQELTAKNAQFRAHLEKNESRPEVQRKLGSLLIIPIQRIPRYKLLLEQVLLYTSPADADYKALKKSINEIDSSVVHINSCIEDQEVTQRLINLQNSLTNRTPTIVQPSRKVIMEGVLNKVNRKGEGMKRYCVLMSDLFMYCKILKERGPNTIVENSLECSCIFPLKKCKIYEHLPGNFKLTCQSDGIIFNSSNVQQSNSWMSCIRDAIDSHIECRKTLRKESSKRAPIRRKGMKKFENDLILSPGKRQSNFENIFRNKNCSDTEDLSSDDNTSTFMNCFSLKKTARSVGVPKSSPKKGKKRSASDKIPMKKSTIKTKNVKKKLKKENVSKIVGMIKTENITKTGKSIMRKSSKSVGTEVTEDNLYCFTNENVDASHSYLRAVSVDNTIPSTIKRSDIIMSGEFQNAVNNSTSASVHNIKAVEYEDASDGVSLPPKRKRVKFEDSLNTITETDTSKTMNIVKNNLKNVQRCKFVTEGTQTPPSTIREKIIDFFANMF